VVKKVPGFDLTKYNPTFSASIDGKDYDFSLKVSNLVEDKSVAGFKISVKEVSAEVTPVQKKLSIKAAMTLPDDLKYASAPSRSRAHALYDSTDKKVKFDWTDSKSAMHRFPWPILQSSKFQKLTLKGRPRKRGRRR